MTNLFSPYSNKIRLEVTSVVLKSGLTTQKQRIIVKQN